VDSLDYHFGGGNAGALSQAATGANTIPNELPLIWFALVP